MNGKSYFPLVMVGVEGSIRHDDVIHEEDAHNLARLGDLNGQQVVVFAREGTAARVVVTDGEDGGIVENDFSHDESYVDGSLCDAAMRDALRLDEFEVLVHHQNPTFLNVEVLHTWKHVVVDGDGRTEVGAWTNLVQGTSLAQFASS